MTKRIEELEAALKVEREKVRELERTLVDGRAKYLWTLDQLAPYLAGERDHLRAHRDENGA